MRREENKKEEKKNVLNHVASYVHTLDVTSKYQLDELAREIAATTEQKLHVEHYEYLTAFVKTLTNDKYDCLQDVSYIERYKKNNTAMLDYVHITKANTHTNLMQLYYKNKVDEVEVVLKYSDFDIEEVKKTLDDTYATITKERTSDFVVRLSTVYEKMFLYNMFKILDKQYLQKLLEERRAQNVTA